MIVLGQGKAVLNRMIFVDYAVPGSEVLLQLKKNTRKGYKLHQMSVLNCGQRPTVYKMNTPWLRTYREGCMTL